jgi:DNA-binding transcriptional ArsR family regulator
MTEKQKKTAIPDPEDLPEEERRAILSELGQRVRRQLENEAIAKELVRRAQEAERRASS